MSSGLPTSPSPPLHTPYSVPPSSSSVVQVEVVVRPQRTGVNLVALPLVAVVCRQPQEPARAVGQRLMHRVAVEDDEVADRIVGGVPFTLLLQGYPGATRPLHGNVRLVSHTVRPGQDGQAPELAGAITQGEAPGKGLCR